MHARTHARWMQQVDLNTYNEETKKVEQDLIFMRMVPNGQARPLADLDTKELALYMPDKYAKNPAERMSGSCSDNAIDVLTETRYVLEGTGTLSNGQVYDVAVRYAHYDPVRCCMCMA